MTTKDKINIAEGICEFALGWAIGGIVGAVTKPKGIVDTVLTYVGSTAIAFTAGRIFQREFTEYCNDLFDVDMEDDNV